MGQEVCNWLADRGSPGTFPGLCECAVKEGGPLLFGRVGGQLTKPVK